MAYESDNYGSPIREAKSKATDGFAEKPGPPDKQNRNAMANKPITPLMHGIIDYGFVAAQLTLPPLLGINKKTVNLYRMLGAGLGTYNALTAHGAAVKPVIPFQTHYKIDYGNVAGLALLTLYNGIRKNKKALLFHTAFVALAAANVLLTDWKGPASERLDR